MRVELAIGIVAAACSCRAYTPVDAARDRGVQDLKCTRVEAAEGPAGTVDVVGCGRSIKYVCFYARTYSAIPEPVCTVDGARPARE
jgi:hypothetical protein